MKKCFAILLSFAIMTFDSCKESSNDTDDLKPEVSTLDVTGIGVNSAVFNGRASLPKTIENDFQIGFEVSTDRFFNEEATEKYCISDYDGEELFSLTFRRLHPETQYYVRAYMQNRMVLYFGEIKTFSTEQWSPMYVDLGLSVKWANCNVGALSPEDYGDYFAWGETEPYYSSQIPIIWKEGKSSGYAWTSYAFYKGSYSKISKYCTNSSAGVVDNKTILDPEDDAACANWGGKWRMPTYAEFDELRNAENCEWIWFAKDNSEYNGIPGYEVRSIKEGFTGNSIFLPAAGFRIDSGLDNAGNYGYYSSSSLLEHGSLNAWYMYFYSGSCYMNYCNRSYGLSVRPVCE